MKKKISLRFLMVLIVIVPAILTGLTAVIVMSHVISSYSNKQIKRELHATGVAAIEAYEMASSGDYVKLDDGTVKKGDLVISNNFDMIDRFKKNTGLDSTFFFGNERVITSLVNKTGERLVDSKVDEKITDIVIKQGKYYYSSDLVIEGVRFCGYYLPLKQQSSNDIVGMYFIGEEYDKAMTSLEKTESNSNLIPIIIVVIIGTSIGGIFASYVVKRLAKNIKQLQSIANGDLTVPIDEITQNDRTEIGELGRVAELLRTSLLNIMSGITKTDEVMSQAISTFAKNSETTRTVTNDVENAMSQIAESSNLQAKDTENASSSVTYIGELIGENIEHINELVDSGNNMNMIQKEVVLSLEKLQKVNEKTQDSIKVIYEQTNTTNLSVQKIEQAAKLITDIADETNLLSLNATIEAARAGEHGKGFAVVASQIQKLADQSNTSAQQITQDIRSLIDASNQSVQSMIEVNHVVEEQNQTVKNTKDMFVGVTNSIKKNDHLCNMISESMSKLDEIRSSIIEVVSNLSALSQENAASIEQTASACDHLNEIMQSSMEEVNKLNVMSEALTQQIHKFKLSNK